MSKMEGGDCGCLGSRHHWLPGSLRTRPVQLELIFSAESAFPAGGRRILGRKSGGARRCLLIPTSRLSLPWKKGVDGELATWPGVEPLIPGGTAAASSLPVSSCRGAGEEEGETGLGSFVYFFF